jgi:signal transduction histidine kinase
MALNASREIGAVDAEGNANHFLGCLMESKGLWKIALRYYEQAAGCGEWIIKNEALKKNWNPHDGTWYTPEQHVPDYIKFKGLSISDSAHYRAYRMCKEHNMYKDAIYHLEMRNEAQAKADQLRKRKDVQAISTRYETVRKEEELARISRENELISLRLSNTRFYMIVLIAVLLIVILLSGLLIRNYHLRKIHETSVLKQKLLRAQLNPHFIFNALSCIQGFIIEKDNISAATYLSRFSKLVRNILISSQEEFIPVSKEIETIDHYLQLQQIRYVDQFDYTIEEDKTVSEIDFMIPSMLVQPFVENAIEHGIKHKKTKGHIKVSFKLKGKTLIIEVTDDGVGYEKARELEKGKKTGNDLSTKLIHERLGLLNRHRRFLKRKARITLQISNLPGTTPPDSGTLIRIAIPLIERSSNIPVF